MTTMVYTATANSVGATQMARPLVLLPAATLWQRELVRFYRQPNRVFGAIAQPLIFWLLFGAGLGASFRPAFQGPGASVGYMEYFFPGSVALILLFTSIFSTMSIIEDRREGFLQAVLAAPVSRGAIVLGKVLGGTTVAMFQALLLTLLAPLLGMQLSFTTVIVLCGVMFLVGFGMTALGFCIAWGLDSVQGFHAVMMVLLMPMWLLSGAFFPAAGVPATLSWVMAANPMSYGVAALRHALYIGDPGRAGPIPGFGTSLLVATLFGVVAFAGAFILASRRDTGKRESRNTASSHAKGRR